MKMKAQHTGGHNFIAPNTYLKKIERFHIINITAYLKTLEQKEEITLQNRQ